MDESESLNPTLTSLESALMETWKVPFHSQWMRNAEIEELRKFDWLTEGITDSLISKNDISAFLIQPVTTYERLQLATEEAENRIEVFSSEVELEKRYRVELERLRDDFSKPPVLGAVEESPTENENIEALKSWIRDLERQEAAIQSSATDTTDLMGRRCSVDAVERQRLVRELIEIQKERVEVERDIFLNAKRLRIKRVELLLDRRELRLRQLISSLDAKLFVGKWITGSIQRSIELNDSLGNLRLALFKAEDAGRKARHRRELERLGLILVDQTNP